MTNATDVPQVKLADAGFLLAAQDVIDRARQFGTTILVWDDGVKVELSVEEAERRLAAEKQRRARAE